LRCTHSQNPHQEHLVRVPRIHGRHQEAPAFPPKDEAVTCHQTIAMLAEQPTMHHSPGSASYRRLVGSLQSPPGGALGMSQRPCPLSIPPPRLPPFDTSGRCTNTAHLRSHSFCTYIMAHSVGGSQGLGHGDAVGGWKACPNSGRSWDDPWVSQPLRLGPPASSPTCANRPTACSRPRLLFYS
jgi:hypothetical protein